MTKTAFFVCLSVLVISNGVTSLLRIPLYRKAVAPEKSQAYTPGGLILLEQVPELITNYHNVYYYGDVEIGTPGERLRVIFDTGSPSLWVYSGSGWDSWTCLPCWIHKSYHHSRSSTYVNVGRPVAINYVSSYIRGYTSKDVLKIGNHSVQVTLAEATSGPFWSSLLEKFDGILGLAPCSGPNCKLFRDLPEPVLGPILRALGSNVFSVYLDRTEKNTGEITFGGINPDLYEEGTLKMHQTTSDYVWTVQLDSIWVGDKLVLDYSNTINEAYVDTGTSLIIGPTNDVKYLLQAAGLNPNGLQVPCTKISDLPPLTFVIGGENYTLQAKDYASVRSKRLWSEDFCYHGLQGLELGRRGWILGDVFLGSHLTVFRTAGPEGRADSIGFARLKKK